MIMYLPYLGATWTVMTVIGFGASKFSLACLQLPIHVPMLEK
jgi:hypothetical protein